MNQQNDAKALLPRYALGVLTEDEQRLVEAYLATNAEARLELAEFEAVSDLLPEMVEPVAPPPAMKQALMARVQADKATVQPAPQPVRKPAQSEGGF